MKYSEEEVLLARSAVGYDSQIRYYKTLESLGMKWATPVREKMQTEHDRNMGELASFLSA